jgi:hypothetical protein
MVLVRPIPPTPTAAIFNKSLGGVIPLPNTWRGTIVKAAPVTTASVTNSRRVISFLWFISLLNRARLHRSFLLTQASAVTKNLLNYFLRERDPSMLIHMFAFRLKPGVSEAQQQRMLTEIGTLKTHISLVLESHVGKNVSPRGQGFVIGGVMKFADQAALDAYNTHPVHQALLKWLVPLIDAIEVDFPAA